MKKNIKIEPTLKEIGEAKKYPNGYVYRIIGNYNYSDAIPPHAIEGVWKVDEFGKITGDYILNKNFTNIHMQPLHIFLYRKISNFIRGVKLKE